MEIRDKRIPILDAAEKLFALHGYKGTSVRDIAQSAGVNLAMISYYFGSKEKLMQAVFEKRTEEIRNKVTVLLEDGTRTPLEKVYVLIDDYIHKIFSQQEFHKIMMQEQMTNKDNPVACMILDTKKYHLKTIKKLVYEGQKTGVFRKSIDMVLMMNTLSGTCNQTIITQHFYREVNNLQALTDEEFKKHLQKKLSIHLKQLFKATLTYDV